MKRIFYLLTMVMAVAGGSLTVRAQAVYPTAKTPTNSFAKLVAEDNVGDVYEKVTVNLDKGTVYADGEKTSLRKVLHCSKKKEEQYLEKSVSGFEKSVENQTVCEVEKTSASKVEITNNFQTKRIIAAVLDSGLVYYTNPSCEIGRKLRDKFNTKMCYVFSNEKNARDTMGHGTMVSSVIAYNTPVKEGYEFQGWYTSLDGGKQVLPTTKMTIPRDHSLYAHWKKK